MGSILRPIHINLASNDSQLLMIGVDMNSKNVEIVDRIWKQVWRDNALLESKVHLHLTAAAVSNVTDTVELTACFEGDEQCSMASDNNRGDKFLGKVNVSVITVDHLINKMHEHVLREFKGRTLHSASTKAPHQHQHTHGRGHSSGPVIDMLVVDTEGNDPLVLRGAQRLLRQHQIRCVAFEYHSEGAWAWHKLQDVVAYLNDFDYSCYFQGTNRLWPITGTLRQCIRLPVPTLLTLCTLSLSPYLFLLLTGSCWHDDYEFHLWSNVLCVNRNDQKWMEAIQPFIQTP